jgi:prepilin-type N-terminal cleavage/methylation domain-containing protein
MKRRGFTLIELLVVIAIITILAGMLVPAVGAARRSARIGACMSNQHNVGLAIQMYLNEPSSNFPGSSAWNLSGVAAVSGGKMTDSGKTLSGHALAALYRSVGGGLAVFSCPGEPTGNTIDMIHYDYDDTDNPLLPDVGYFLTNTGYIMDTATNPGTTRDASHLTVDNGIPLSADPARAVMVCGRGLYVPVTGGVPGPAKPDPTMHGNPAGAVVLFVSMNAEFVLDADPVDEAVLLNPGYPASSAIVDNVYKIDGALKESQDCSAAPPRDDLVPPLDPKDPGYGG